jgi:urocanate hydratase
MMANDPETFKIKVQESLRRQVKAINTCVEKFNTYFFDYGNAFLLESGRAHADIFKADGKYKYPSYVQDIMGPSVFDFGFGPFRWGCTSGKRPILATTDAMLVKCCSD